MKALYPDFSHHLSTIGNNCEEFTLGELTDSVLLMCGRAAAIIELVTLQFEGEASKLNDAINVAALTAAVNEIHDIEAVTKAFYNNRAL
jgi:hypothetical protein